VEVGTVTPVPQTGNARPRIFRLPARRALLNQMGFPNQGSRAVAERLRRRRHRRAGSAIVGANVGKNRATPPSQAPDDYRALVRELAGCCDYLAINVSSPNTPGLRELQAPELLCPVVRAMQDELSSAGAKIPLLLKISPDVDGGQLDELADLALELSLDGIIAVNTTLDRSGVEGCAEIVGVHGGGVSGAPLQQRALEVLRRLHARTGNRLVLISVGGIQTAHDAWERIQAGATLLQGYTGFVYEGPCWARRINRGLARRVREEGGASIEDLMRPGTLRSGTPR
jgi:dihydroorotate dehydrogenase